MPDSGIENWTGQVHQGDAAETLAEMPESSVHCVMTSPPYYGLRDYGVDGQIGLEESLDEYIGSIVEVAEELRRVLRSDGSWWLNLGDSFAGSWGAQSKRDEANHRDREAYPGKNPGTNGTLRRKTKMLVPHRVAIALQEAGWIVRNDVTWIKPNPMPSSVEDRLNTTTEMVFHLTPEPDYWYDLDAIREPYETTHDREPPIGGVKHQGNENPTHSGNTPERTGKGKNPGDVFEVAPKPFPDAHFAVYPPGLCEKPIKASCPPRVCAACGTPYDRETEKVPMWERDPESIEREQTRRALEIAEENGLTDEHFEAAQSVGLGNLDASEGNPYQRVDQDTANLAREAADVLGSYYREALMSETKPTDEWSQACDCETDETEPGIVLDPFAGAGTTLLVAKDLGRRFVGIDLNKEYIALAQKRVGLDVDRPELLLEDDGQQTLSIATDGGGSR